MTLKRPLVALLAASALVTLAACGGNADNSGSPAPGEKVTLKFQSLAFQKTTVAASKKIVADWNAAHPDIQVEYVQGSWDSVHDQLVTQFQGGTAPDIIQDESADITGFASQGYLADLSPYLSQQTKDAVPQGVWDSVSGGGKTFAAPTLLQSYVVFGNSALLKQAGISTTGDSLTWDGLVARYGQLWPHPISRPRPRPRPRDGRPHFFPPLRGSIRSQDAARSNDWAKCESAILNLISTSSTEAVGSTSRRPQSCSGGVEQRTGPLKPEFRKPGMVSRAGPRTVPMEFAFGFLDRAVVDGGKAPLHQAVAGKLPVLVAIGAKPVSGIVVPFVSEADGDAVSGECP